MAIKIGSRNNDHIVGGAGADALLGLEGDDVLFGGGGYDLVDGGRGFDTARYAGSFLDYSISRNFIGYTVNDLRAGGPDGIDLLHNVEALQFSDRIIYIDGRNNAPVPVNDSSSTNEDTAVRISAASLLANDRDFDGDRLTLVSVGGATHGTVSLAGGIVTFTPVANYNGAAGFTYTVRDSRGAQSTGTVNVAVQAINDAPINKVPGAQSVNEDTSLTVAGVSVADVDAASVRVTLSAAHGVLSLSRTTGLAFTSGDGTADAAMTFRGTQANVNAALNNLVYRASLDYNGADSITLTTNDLGSSGAGGALGDTDSIAVTVRPVNDAPVAVNDSRSVNEDTRLNGASVLSNDTDADRNALTARLVTGPAHGALTLNSDGTFVYTPTANFNGTDSFTYRAFDGAANSNVATVTIAVSPVNDAPVAVNDPRTATEDTPLNGASVLGNDSDVDGNALTAKLVSGTAHGRLTLNPNGTFLYTPNADFNGTDSFTYRAFDGAANSNVATVTIAVKAVNDAPTFFGSDGKVTVEFTPYSQETGRAIVVQANGKITVAGETAGGFALARFNADGSLDTSFDGDGKVITTFPSGGPFAYGMALQSDGRIVVGGYVSYSGNADFAIARYNANGSLDTSFDGDGRVTTGFAPANYDLARAVAVQADGKILAAGGSDFYDFAIVRYNQNGSLDTSFSGDGKAVTALSANADSANAIGVQSDGKIVAAGFRNDGTWNDFAIVRYNADGSLDTSFDGDGVVTTDFEGRNDVITGVALQADGKILVGGYSEESSGRMVFAAARYNADGSLDASFDGDGKLTTALSSGSMASAIVLQPNGKFVLAGDVGTDIALARYNADGSLDTSFDGDGQVVTDFGNEQGYAVTVQADGKILLSGQMNADFVVVRYNVDGSLDTTFGRGNTLNALPTFLEDQAPVVLDKDVQVIDTELAAQGHYAGARLTLVRHGGANSEDRYSETGLLGALTQGVVLTYDGANVGAVTTNSGGTLVLTFNAGATQARLNGVLHSIAYSNSSDTPPGSVQIDWNFSDGNSGAQGSGGALAAIGSTTVTIVPSLDAPIAENDAYSGKQDTPLIGASVLGNDHDPEGDPLTAVLVSGPSHGTLTFNADGTFGYTPSSGFSGTDSFTYHANDGVLDSNDATATVTVESGGPPPTGNGKVTTDFGDNDFAQAMTLQPDGRIVLAGTSTDDFAVARYNADGTLDSSFSGDGKTKTDLGNIFESPAVTAVQPDGKVLVAGGSNGDFAIVRYNVDGALDPTFDGDGIVTTDFGGSDGAGSISVLPDGRIFAIGVSAGGLALARYNPDGSLDTSFDGDGKLTTPIGPGGAIAEVLLQPDGRILAAGTTQVSPLDFDFAVARYHADGTPDTTFGIGGTVTTDFASGSDYLYAMALQSDGKVLVGGSVENAGQYDFGIVRYNADGSLDTSFDGDGKLVLDLGSFEALLDVVVQPDGRIVAAGSDDNDFAVLRLNGDGSLDTTFGGGGIVTTDFAGASDRAWAMDLQADGRLVLAGHSLSSSGTGYDFAMARYNTDGSLDATFGAGGYTFHRLDLMNETLARTAGAAP